MLNLLSSTFIRQIVSGFLQIITISYISFYLGEKGVGEYTLIVLIPLSISQIITFGLPSINIFSIGRRRINENQAFYVNIIFLIPVVVISFIFTVIVLLLFGGSYTKAISNSLVYISLVALAPLTFISVLPSLLQATQNFKLFNIISIIYPVVIFIFIVLSLSIERSIDMVIYAFVFGNWVVLFILFLVLLRIVKFKVQIYSIKEFNKTYLKYGLSSHLSNIVTFFNYKMSLFILGYFVSPVFVGIYTVGSQLVEKLWLPSQTVSTILLPKLSRKLEDDGDNNDQVIQFTLIASRLTLVITFVASIVLLIIIKYLIIFLFDEKYLDSIWIVIFLLPGILAWVPSRILANDLAARGYANLNLYNSYKTFFVNFTLNIVFIPIYGIYGAAFSTSCAYISDLIFRVITFSKAVGVEKIYIVKSLIPNVKDVDFIKLLLKQR